LNQQDTYPSIGYMIQGADNVEPATTIWELWDSNSEGPSMNSRNHIMFGTVGSWFYKALLGYSPNGDTIGVGPDFSIVNVNNITSAHGQTVSPYGTVEVEWFVARSSACTTDTEGNTVELSCPTGVINGVIAYYGNPTGNCGNGFKAGTCNSTNAYTAVSKACMGKPSCDIPVSNDFFGGDPCPSTTKSLAVHITCSASPVNPIFILKVSLPVGQSNTLVHVPIVPNLKQSPQNIQIREGSTLFWSNSKYVPGVAGIIGAHHNPTNHGITVIVGSGKYQFATTAQ